MYTSCGTVVRATSDNSTDMLYLQTFPFTLVSLAESASIGTLAAIQGGASSAATATTDTQVQLFRSDYFTPVGTFALLPFVTSSGSYPAHGKGVFFSRDSSRIYVVAQADPSSNLGVGWAVEALKIGSPTPCSVTPSSSSLSSGSSGGYASAAIAAAPDCVYAATSAQTWISFVSGSYGSGNGTLRWLVRPNPLPQARSGTITINGSVITVQQAATPALPNPAALGFTTVDATYSKSLDRIVAVSATPNELHIYDPAAQTDRAVTLAMTPSCVSVSPDGSFAAVGHDGYVSYVDLKAGSVLKVFPVPSPFGHVLLAGNGYIYVSAGVVYSIQTTTGTVTPSSGALGIGHGLPELLEPNDKYFYTVGTIYSKWDITNGLAVSYETGPSNANLGSNAWLFEDGTELVGQSGQVLVSSDTKTQDGRYIGVLPNASGPNTSGLQWAANSSILSSIASIPAADPSAPIVVGDNEVDFYGTAYLGAAGKIPLPQFSVGGQGYTAHGQYVFWNAGATALSVIQRADNAANLQLPDAVFTISPSAPPPGCSASPLTAFQTLPAGGGLGSAPVSAGIGCPWSAVSDSTWLSITAGGMGGGPASVSWSAAANTGAASRTAHIAVGGASYPVTQLGAPTTPLSLNPSALTFTAVYGATAALGPQIFSVKTGAGPYTVSASPSWVTVTAGGASTYSVSVSPANVPAGANIGSVNVTASDGQVQTVTVTLTVTPNLVASPSSLTLQYGSGDPLPSASFTVADGTSGSTAFNIFLSVNSLVTTRVSSPTLPATIQVTPTANLPFGAFSAVVTVTVANGSVGVPLKVTHTAAPISVTAVTDAANFSQGAVSPGEIVAIWGANVGPATLTSFTLAQGRLPTSLAGTSVSFNQYPAPLIYSSAGAVSAVVPYEIAGQSTANVTVSYGGAVSTPLTVSIAPTAPHFFTSTYQSVGQIVTLNADNSVNSSSNPASAGSVVVMYATGEGVTSPPGIDGSAVGSNLTRPLANVAVTIGGQPAEVLYAGGSPGSIEGLLQLNVRVPAGTPPGNAPVTLSIGSATAPAGGTIAVGP